MWKSCRAFGSSLSSTAEERKVSLGSFCLQDQTKSCLLSHPLEDHRDTALAQEIHFWPNFVILLPHLSQRHLAQENYWGNWLRDISCSEHWPQKKSIAKQFSLRNLLIFNLSLSDLWLCLIAMPVTLTEIKVALIVIVIVIEIIIPMSLP